MRSRNAVALCAAGLLSAAPLLGGIASAETEQNQSGNQRNTEARIAEFLQNNPGSQQIDTNKVKVHEGMIRGFANAPAQQHECGDGYLCLYDQPNFEGDWYELYQCGLQALPADWANRMHSYRNYQTGEVEAVFLNWNADNKTWEEVGRSTARDENPAVDEQLATTDGATPC